MFKSTHFMYILQGWNLRHTRLELQKDLNVSKLIDKVASEIEHMSLKHVHIQNI